MNRWRVRMVDGTAFDSADGHAWSDVPDDGIALIVIMFPDTGDPNCERRRRMDGHDRYWFVPGAPPWGKDAIYSSNDSEEEILRRYPTAQIKRGQWMPDEAFLALVVAEMER